MFLSMTEAPLLIRPLLSDCTESELHAIMTAGFASVAGAVLAAYISFGASASDLLAATIMSAPAALAISKLVFPETKKVSTRQSLFEFEMVESEDPNMIAAASNGAALAVEMVLQIGGQLIAIIALVDMLNGWLKGIGSLIDIALSLQIITSYIFFPFAWLMGVPTYDCSKVASLIGTKIIVNEFAAFQELGVMVKNDAISSKAITIATYALCGFSNISSIGVTVGVLSSLVPGKKKVIIKLVTSAMIAGNTACFMTACIAGLFYDASLDAKDSVEFVEFDGNSTDPTV
jgi:nucleoside transporter